MKTSLSLHSLFEVFPTRKIRLTLAVGSIIWDEDSHVVRWTVASHARAVVATKGVVTCSVLPTDLNGSYLALIFV